VQGAVEIFAIKAAFGRRHHRQRTRRNETTLQPTLHESNHHEHASRISELAAEEARHAKPALNSAVTRRLLKSCSEAAKYD